MFILFNTFAIKTYTIITIFDRNSSSAGFNLFNELDFDRKVYFFVIFLGEELLKILKGISIVYRKK